ncbi:MAG: methionine--tRNA ligase subunit beta, partial [Acidobacteria bacterium]
AVMIDKYRGGVLPAGAGTPGRLAAAAEGAVARYRAAMDAFALHEATFAAFSLVDAANEYIAETEPWTLARQGEQDRLTQVLSDVVEAVRIATVLLLPVMPGSAAEILRRVGETRPANELRLEADTAWSGRRERRIAKSDPLWPRIGTPAPALPTATSQPPSAPAARGTQETAMSINETKDSTPPLQPATFAADGSTPAPAPAIQPPGPAPAAAPGPDRIGIEDFAKVDLRVAKILAAEKVKGSKKLIKMQIDVGVEQRTIVAGIAEAYEPETLVGRSIVVVFNLKPAKLMGIESNGMVLAASPEGGLPALLGFENPPPPGSRVK